MKPTGPYGGIVGAKVAFIEMPGAPLRTPMQLGPTIRIPWRRTISSSCASLPTPSPPTSANPAVMTTSPFTPFFPHSSAAASTRCFGTTMTASSTGSGIADTLGYARIEWTTAAWGLTGYSGPLKP